jgi:group I intron endonuclease
MQVYLIRNTLDGKGYVGKTTTSLRRRVQAHIDACSPIGRAIKAEGRKHFTIEPLESFMDKAALDEAERAWIARLNTLEPNGYNVREGGAGGGKWCEAGKARIRGRKLSDEHRAKISAARKGKPANEGQRKGLEAGRHAPKNLIGERNGHHILTAAQVQEIRRLYKPGVISQVAIAARFGVKQVTVSAIVRRHSWKHLPEEY